MEDPLEKRIVSHRKRLELTQAQPGSTSQAVSKGNVISPAPISPCCPGCQAAASTVPSAT